MRFMPRPSSPQGLQAFGIQRVFMAAEGVEQHPGTQVCFALRRVQCWIGVILHDKLGASVV